MDAENFSAWYFKGEKLLAVDCINNPKDFMVAKKLIASDSSPSKAAVADLESSLA